jgi:hypothetical protein
MLPSPMVGCFRLGPFGIRDARAPTINGCGVVHLDPDHRNAGPADVGHVVATETWSGEDSSMPEIVVYNLVFPDVPEENHPGFEKDLVLEWVSAVGDFGVPQTGRSQCSAP